MNAAIRAVARQGFALGARVVGFRHGLDGIFTSDYIELTARGVGGVLDQGGTFLGTGRSARFREEGGPQLALDALAAADVDSLAIIGGDGSMRAALSLHRLGFPVVGIPGTIDNDLNGTDTTIGYDTALNTIMQSMDKIRDTATSHERLFFVEVMGRNCGFLALNSAIASGAEAAIIPEISIEKDQLGELIEQGFRKSKNSSMVLVTESEVTGGAIKLAERVKTEYPQYDVRVSILGHLQRGGSPSAQDRILASRMGIAAIQALLENQRNVMIGIHENEIDYVPFKRAIKKDREISEELLEVLRISSI